ncbi:NAD(P)/FAD-dependent oxidoreductase [Candidatus Palauibacter sp.]|uniref:NAD(P)/FAD-dependent oxidoreductase n=1 Tax=Candidatus Palauibacter sp. TaxID=3101350 RepID=UPI003AF28EAF
MRTETVDITIIGGGPTGLYGLFYAGMRGVSARIIDVLPELGGQLTALYPEKDVFDVAGFPRVLAKDLARDLVTQALQFDAEVCLEERVLELNPGEEAFDLRTDEGPRPTRTVVIAGGKGAFKSRTLAVPGWDEFWKRGLTAHVKDPESFRGKRVLIVGGGDSAFDWSWALREIAGELTHIHRSNRYRAHERTVEQVEGAHDRGELALRTFHTVTEIHGTDRVEAATLQHTKTKETVRIEVDEIVALIGFVPNIGPIAEWGIELEGNAILVDSRMQTNIAGVYAAGDIATYEGKLELISTGFGEAAIAVNNAVHYLDPSAKVNPGHSTSSKAFK